MRAVTASCMDFSYCLIFSAAWLEAGCSSSPMVRCGGDWDWEELLSDVPSGDGVVDLEDAGVDPPPEEESSPSEVDRVSWASWRDPVVDP